ncbi:MAG TPA: hypothetical protein VIO81_03575, partial [Methyloversatilis sp.]
MEKTQATPGARPKVAESEKITINLGFVDLGQIDLLVAEGFYSNRTDFIRTAIRNHLTSHAEAVRQVVARRMFVLGMQHFTADYLRGVQAANETLHIRVLGDHAGQHAADRIGHCGRAAAVGHVGQRHLGGSAQQLADEVHGGACTGG